MEKTTDITIILHTGNGFDGEQMYLGQELCSLIIKNIPQICHIIVKNSDGMPVSAACQDYMVHSPKQSEL